MPFRDESNETKEFVGIGIDITEKCNRSCPTCFADRGNRNMDMGIFKKIADEGAVLGFKEFYILGGEPTLHSDIIECLKYATSKYDLVILVTNMDKLSDPDFCQKVFETGVVVAGQRHTLSSDKEAEVIETTVTGKNTLQQSHRAWANVEKIFPPERVCVQCCITRPVVDSKSIFKVFRWIRKKGYAPVMEFTKEGRAFKRGCELDVAPKEMLRTFKEFQKIDIAEFGLNGAEILTPQAYGKTCHMQERSIHFDIDGTARPCVGFPNIDYGNIEKNSLKSILENPLRQLIKDPHNWIYGYCRDECLHFNLCTGGCRGSARDMSGCYRASFYYCPHIPRDRLSLKDMIPPTCEGCPLEGNPSCNPRREL